MISIIRHSLIFLSLLSISSGIQSTEAYKLQLPIVDLPYNERFSPSNPSMTQSLYITKGFYQSAHYGISKFWKHKPRSAFFSILAFDVLSTWMPLSDTWLHEEWHRAVMGQHGIDSYNEVYDMNFFSETISVSGVRDEGLIRLKQEHPQDLIRLHAAGLESQNQLNLNIQKGQFFDHTKTDDRFVLLSNSVNTSAYLYTCASNDSTRITNKILKREGQNIADRDFAGLDCNAWVYDLFRPDEPYADRDIHPSGVGVNRYITYSMLTGAENGSYANNTISPI